MFESATDDSARVVNHARDALSQGRIADALDTVDRSRHDEDLDEAGRASLALTGLLGKLALGDLRGAASYSRDLTTLMRVRGVVGAIASFGLGEFAAARGQADQAVSYYERAGEELTAATATVLAAVAQRAGPRDRRPRRDRPRRRAGRGGARRGADPRLAVRRRLRAAHQGRDRADRATAWRSSTRRSRSSTAPAPPGSRPRSAPTSPAGSCCSSPTSLATGHRPAPHVPRSTPGRRSSLRCSARIRWLLERLGEAPDGELRRPAGRAQRRRAPRGPARGRRQAQPRDRSRARA